MLNSSSFRPSSRATSSSSTTSAPTRQRPYDERSGRRGAPRVSAQILPDLNPIEQVFAKFKTLLRKAEARTYDAVADASAAILAQYPPEECAAYVKNAGYA